MGTLNDSGDYEINPAFSDGQAGPGGLLGLLRQVSPQSGIQTGVNSGPNSNGIAILPGALLGGLAILGAHRLLQQHYPGSHTDGTTLEPADPNFRQLSRRPSSQPAINGDQPVATYSSGANASPASSDIAVGAAQHNPTANFTGESLAAKAPDPAKPKVSTILGGPSIVPAEGEPPPDDDGDDMCMRQKNKEDRRCYDRKKRSPKWKYLQECLSRASVRWDMCNRTGQIPDEPDEWGPQDEGR